MDGIGFWAAAVAAAMLVGMAKGGLPVVGMLGVPVFSFVVSPVAAAGILLPIYVVSDAFGIWAYRRAFDRRILAIMAAGMTVGVGLGWATASVVSERVVTGLVGAIGVVFAANLILRPQAPGRREARVGPGIFWGAVTLAFAYVNAIKLVPYAALGQLSPANLGVAAWLAGPAIAAVFLGVRLVRVLPEALFFRIVTWALLAVSIRLLWVAAAG
mgnify:CR=1 FL=1